ncbi:hypothetical protein, partial [Staphylococcus epidermidis]
VFLKLLKSILKFLDDYNEFDKVELVNHAERLLKDEMRGEQNDN